MHPTRRPKPLYADPQTLADARRGLWRAPKPGIGAARADVSAENDGSDMSPLAAALPAAARIGMGGGGNRVLNPKIWEEDTKRFTGPKFDIGPWLATCRKASRDRRKGDVLKSTMDRVCQALALGDPTSGGMAKRRMSHASIAGFVGCSIETVRKVVRWAEKANLFDTWNVLVRDARGLLRNANMYLLRMPDPPPTEGAIETPPPAAELGVVVRLTMKLERWKASFGLQARAWGLNATAVSWENLRKERDPEPT